MSQKELKRITVLERVLGGSMTRAEAADSLGITCRQMSRIKKKYEEEGANGLVHGNSGRKPRHALTEAQKQEVLNKYDEKYYGSNFCHLSELLEEHEGIKISPSSVERILKSAGRKTKNPQKRRKKQHRARERRSQAGMLWQTDATPYEWLGDKFGKFALHAMIDDATGIVTGAYFTINECLEGYSAAMRLGIEKYGIPLGVYSDRHTIFRSPGEGPSIDEQLNGAGEVRLTNFGRALQELNIEHIKANTPQAKGRIERLWKTFQDRLPVELRLLGVKSIDEANAALPKLLSKHNKNFSVTPIEKENAYRILPEGTRLEYVFTRRETRQTGGGCVIKYDNNAYIPEDACYFLPARTTVEVRETFSGDVIICHNGHFIKLRRIKQPERAASASKNDGRTSSAKAHKPAEDHPWRSIPVIRGRQAQVQNTLVSA